MQIPDILFDLVHESITINEVEYRVDTSKTKNPVDALIGVGECRSLLVRAIRDDVRYVVKLNMAPDGAQHFRPDFFENEAATLTYLKERAGIHPSVVQLEGVEREVQIGGLMEGSVSMWNVDMLCYRYIEGRSLEKTIEERQPLSEPDIVAQVCDALEYCHKNNVVHRDLRPANIIVSAQGTSATLVDFGIAQNPRYTLRTNGTFLGTQGHSAPEVKRGEVCDARADQYSLGVIVRDLVRGEDLNPRLQTVIDKALANDPSRRYPTMAEFAREVVPLLQQHRRERAA